MILWMIKRAQARAFYLYLGYWIDGSDKMAYKAVQTAGNPRTGWLDGQRFRLWGYA